MTPSTEQLVNQLANRLVAREWKLAIAESCTGGGLAYSLTNLPGSSNWFDRGFVTYSNQAKQDLLGVSPLTLSVSGAVSEQTAREMAEGVLQHSQAQLSIAITGIAGPDGGSAEKPVGTVWFAWASINGESHACVDIFSGDRQTVREQAIQFALEKLLTFLEK